MHQVHSMHAIACRQMHNEVQIDLLLSMRVSMPMHIYVIQNQKRLSCLCNVARKHNANTKNHSTSICPEQQAKVYNMHETPANACRLEVSQIEQWALAVMLHCHLRNNLSQHWANSKKK